MDSQNFDDIIIIFKERIKYFCRSAKSTKTTFYENTCSYESSYENTVSAKVKLFQYISTYITSFI